MKEQRIEWIDVAKGIGIICVVIGHLNELPHLIYFFVNSFHMPLFFFLSGCTFKRNVTFVEFIKKRIRTIVIPYLVLGIPFLPWTIINSGDNYILSEVVTSFCFDFFVNLGWWHLWFITALFWVNILYYLIDKYMSSRVFKEILICIMFALGILYTKRFGYLPWNFNVALTGLFFFRRGHEFVSYEPKVRKMLKNFSVCVVAVVLFITAWELKSELGFRSVCWGIVPLTVLLAMIETYIVVEVSKITHCKVLQYWGRNSLIIYMWHWPVLTIAMKLWSLTIGDGISSDFFRVFQLAFTLAGVSILCVIMNIYPFSLVLGRKLDEYKGKTRIVE